MTLFSKNIEDSMNLEIIYTWLLFVIDLYWAQDRVSIDYALHF